MLPTFIHAQEWSRPEQQFFITLGLGSEDVLFHESRRDANGKFPISLKARVERSSPINVLSYSPEKEGIVGCGDAAGNISVINLLNPMEQPLLYNVRYPRPCSSVSFNASSLLAAGFDRVRNDESLFIWDINQEQQSAHSAPLAKYLTNEGVAAAGFITHQSLSSTLLVATYKSIREIDLRMSTPISQVFTKYAYGLCVSRSNEHVFMTNSDSGNIALWDRRHLQRAFSKTNQAPKSPEPLLVIPRVLQETQLKSHSAIRFHNSTSNEFAAISNGNSIRRWMLSSFPVVQNLGGPVSSLSSAVRSSAHPSEAPPIIKNTLADSPVIYEDYSPFIRSVRDVHLPADKVVGFEYADDPETGKLGFVCMRQSGQLFRAALGDIPEGLVFTPDNALHSLCDGVSWELDCGPDSPVSRQASPGRSPPIAHRGLDEQELEESLSSSGDETDQQSQRTDIVAAKLTDFQIDDAQARSKVGAAVYNTLRNDVPRTIRHRALSGYGSNPKKNLEVLVQEASPAQSLKSAWVWLQHASSTDESGIMVTDSVDLGFEGVYTIWSAGKHLDSSNRLLTHDPAVSFEKNVDDILHKCAGSVFVSPELVSSPRYAVRQLCLYVCGWTFPISELEQRLTELEDSGQHEKAAAWAVFHGDVKRAVTSLGASRKSQLRLMSSAVAGYSLYKEVESNNPWRDQCRKLALEMSEPYLRAIFAYIADGSWLDVLDDSALPLAERLGIALRFLPDVELMRYLQGLVNRCVKHGDLEGLVLTGISPLCLELVQSYVDNTGDVQTAALIGAFGSPRFFQSPVCEGWFIEYRALLNKLKLFSQRAHFDIGRTQLARRGKGEHHFSPIPKQAYLQCSYCLTKFEQTEQQGKPSVLAAGNRCRNCNHPQPRCAVCSLSLGTKISEHNFDRWPCFCMSCNHGFHSLHARLWFRKYEVCPVPDCFCNCGSI